MKIKISREWLKATGNFHLADIPLEAAHVPYKSRSAMGDYYDVILPDGRIWGVFSIRGVEVVA